jgi:subtilisin-like proprotein convertase family protein
MRVHQAMKQLLCVMLLNVGLSLHADVYSSQTYSNGFQSGGVIPDGDLTGWSDTRTVSGASGLWTVSDVQVTLDISGGYNGDLYAYLEHGSSGFAVLLNRVGVGSAEGTPIGYDNPGLDITLASGGANGNIHWYGGAAVPTGTYQPDGRNINPLSPPASFDSAATDANFSTFTGLDPNGQWTLFIADVSAGGGQSTVVSWGLDVDAIPQAPEPGTMAIAVLGLVLWRLRVAVQKWCAQTSLRPMRRLIRHRDSRPTPKSAPGQ